ncbi:hypothetical protein [Amycolatopsis minnesotensis]|uniref:Uncharacterized protein n=1 Tax=Amycolatopsis minnesotensis TaxID=337894 RepID=A0ABP5CFL6_9PSEU
MGTYPRCPPLGIRPDVASTIGTGPQPPEVLLLRGKVTITEFGGMLPEQAEAACRFFGEEGGARYVAEAERAETRTARIAPRPAWAGTLEFRTRNPGIARSQG